MKGKVIILGVTGGIAAYKAAELLRLFVKAGADAHVIMTKAAQRFVTPLTFQTLSGNPVHTKMFNLIDEREIGHISLSERADIIVIAPATANFIGKVASGIADDLLTTTVMATKAPILIAPAMNTAMYHNPIYRENEEKLRRLGCHFVDPSTGMLACGWEGEGKLQEPAVIFEAAGTVLSPKDFCGRTVIVTAGPTREEMDPVRFFSNYSSGKMGYAIARAARRRGARVSLVTGPVSLAAPWGVETISVTSAREMREAVLRLFDSADVVIKTAAVADYRPEERSSSKIRKGETPLTVKLVKNPDILAELGRNKGDCFLVGFAAETGDAAESAARKLSEKNLDMVVGNDVTCAGAGFAVDTNIVKILTRDGRTEAMPLMGKDELADEILDRISERLGQGRKEENR
ncbi:MAG: bifunctional phosphopantothenoylcysteine decarboxylase/phosphopantothenate--cysteine ligase CoaBC [Geobacteraceae bacterium]|nr:bifunctional phosphopantothenoylcysteine decarboxylase/phosphopantothenate--cysteine ligase CoaBC [Geobacteraceae bacterium]